MNDIAVRYHKDLIVAEVSMGYTMEDYSEYEKLSKEERKGMATRAEVAARAEYPMTVEGQCQFMQDFMKRIGNVPENRYGTNACTNQGCYIIIIWYFSFWPKKAMCYFISHLNHRWSYLFLF